jgi:CTP:molybdopterin cytidylyltransferase MocA
MGVSAIVLAAGASARMGRPKQLLPWRGRPLAQAALDAAAAGGVDEVVVVLGHEAAAVGAALALPPLARVLVNPVHAQGQSTSLRAGLAALAPDASAAVVLLGDQPGVRPDAVRALVRAHRDDPRPVLRAAYAGRAGHPVLLGRAVWEEAAALRGDQGARALMARAPERVGLVEVGGRPPEDVDTPEDYARLS